MCTLYQKQEKGIWRVEGKFIVRHMTCLGVAGNPELRPRPYLDI
jgi:hypothetical protein